MRNVHIGRALAGIALLGLAAGGCAGTETEVDEAVATNDEAIATNDEAVETEADREDFHIGVSFPDSTTTLYVEMEAGINELAPELGVETTVVYAGGDPAQQLDDVNTLIANGADAILISPIDSEASKPAYEHARSQGVPIISIARSTSPELEDSFVGAPWEDYGEEIAKWTCEATGGEGSVAMLKGPAGASFVDEMERGYKEYLANDCSGLSIVFETNVVPMTSDQSLPAAQDALTAHPDLDVIYSQLDDMVGGVIAALEEQGRLEEVVITGFDGSPEGFAFIREGKQDMTIALQPFKWGQLGLKTALDVLQGEEVGDLVTIESTLVDQSNIGQYADEDLR